jgi:hypothetical protein
LRGTRIAEPDRSDKYSDQSCKKTHFKTPRLQQHLYEHMRALAPAIKRTPLKFFLSPKVDKRKLATRRCKKSLFNGHIFHFEYGQ